MYDLLPEEKVVQLKAKLTALKRAVNSYTVWEMVDPPLKSPEEIKQIKDNEKAEIETITKILKENTRKKREATRLKNLRARMQEK